MFHEINLFQGYVHYRTRKRKVEYEKPKTNLPKRKKREKISKFSDESRKRLHRECLKIRFSQDFYFVTLTYQSGSIDLEDETVEWKNDLQRFRVRIARSIPTLSALWKLEFTKLGVPHYHLITHCQDTTSTELRNLVRKEWLKVTGSGSRGRFAHAVKVQQVGNLEHVTRYMAKYVSKDAHETNQEYVGRYWGYHNKGLFPHGELLKARLTRTELEHIRRVLACVYVPSKWKNVRANLTCTDQAFAVYLPYHIQFRLFSPFIRENEPF